MATLYPIVVSECYMHWQLQPGCGVLVVVTRDVQMVFNAMLQCNLQMVLNAMYLELDLRER